MTGLTRKTLSISEAHTPNPLDITGFLKNLILLFLQFPKGVPKDLHNFCRAEKYIGRSIEVVITASTRNRVYQKWYRGFESHLLRHGKVLHSQNLAFLFHLLFIK